MKVLSTFFCLCIAVQIQASRAFHVSKSITQRDGTTLTIVLQGDENFSYYSTLDNIPVFQKGQTFYYGRINANGKLEAGTQIAHDASLRSTEEKTAVLEIQTQFRRQMSTLASSQAIISLNQEKGNLTPIGTLHIPVILVQYADLKFVSATDGLGFVDDVSFFQKHFNAENYTGEGSGSVRDYFIAQSDSQFLPVFDIIGPVTLSKNMSYYGADAGGRDANFYAMVHEALDSAIKVGADFTPYFMTATKTVPTVAIIYAGYGQQASTVTDAIWSKDISSLYYTSGGILFKGVCCTNEIAKYYSTSPVAPDGIGTFCHEFSHELGLHDLYNTNGLSGIFGMDYWDLMDYGQFWDSGKRPVGYSAYEREYMNWLTIDTLQKVKQFVTLCPLNSSSKHKAYRILNQKDVSGNEYYILENRQKSPWYNNYSGFGMLVTHVDYDASSWTNNTINNVAKHQRMTIIPADNVLTQHQNISGNYDYYEGDPFPGLKDVTTLSDYTMPSDTAYTGQHMNVLLTEIQTDADNNITFCYMANGKLAMPLNITEKGISTDSFTVHWDAVEQAERYEVALLQNGAVLQTDTVSSTSIGYLRSAGDFAVNVKALAADYIDSDVQTFSFTTTGINTLIAQGVDKAKVFTVDGRYLGTVKLSQMNTLPSGLYLMKTKGKAQKVFLK